METLLIIAIVLTAISLVIQAGALLAIYLLSRRVANHVNGLVNESHKLIPPLEGVATNLKSASDDLSEIGKSGREQLHHIQTTITETSQAIRDEVQDLRARINETVDDLQTTVMSPVREFSAIAAGISAGLRTLFRRRPRTERVEQNLPKTPAA